MTKTAYLLKKLHVKKMPGLPAGLKAMNDLAPHVNIITGPNASGKSSTARAIAQMIWPGATRGTTLSGSATINSEQWEVDIDSDRVISQRDGIDDRLKGIPAPEEGHRYLLALHELVNEEEGDLASEIMRQSIGGYDLNAASAALQYSASIRSKKRSEFMGLENTEKLLKEESDKQQELIEREGNLQNLEAQKKRAEEALRESQFYDKVLLYLKARQAYHLIDSQLEEFPPQMQYVSGEEFLQITRYEEDAESARRDLQQLQNKMEGIARQLINQQIPHEGVPAQSLIQLEELVNGIKEIERDLRSIGEDITALIVEEQKALEAIAPDIDTARWEGLDTSRIAKLDEFLQQAHTLLGQRSLLTSEVENLQKEANAQQASPGDSDALISGIRILTEWLREPAAPRKSVRLPLILLSAAGAVTAILVWWLGTPGLASLLLIAGLLIYFFYRRENPSLAGLRQNDYLSTGLEPPTQWDTPHVSELLATLIETLKQQKHLELIRIRLKEREQNLVSLDEQMDELNHQRAELQELLHAMPSARSIATNGLSSLYWFLTNAKKWHEVHARLMSQQARSQAAEKEMAARLKLCNQIITRANYEAANDASSVFARFKAIKDEEEQRAKWSEEIGRLKERLKETKRIIENTAQREEAIYHKLKIETGQKEKVRQLVEKKETWENLLKRHFAAKDDFTRKATELKAHSLYPMSRSSIETLKPDQAEEKLRVLKEEADKLQNIGNEISGIKSLIEDYKRRHSLEKLLAQRETALENLADLYEQNLTAITGDLIIEQLKQETREQNRPAVFKEASQLFNQITNGRYELSLSESEPPAFRAYDTQQKLGQELDTLSTGTRVQLLLAVRLAYIEHQEQNIKLPLLADELLANSDDQRAAAIIEALTQISLNGRQVFYFTAQPDEVQKWESWMQKHPNLNYRIIELAAGEHRFFRPVESEPSLLFAHEVPLPEDLSREEYGRLIGTGPFDLLQQEVAQLPLWYLINDNRVLYNCLKRGINTWGPLQSFRRHNGIIAGINRQEWQTISQKADLLKQYQLLFRQGHPRPIDREMLLKSGAISENFIDSVAEKLIRCENDPKKLLISLRNKEVPRFREYNIDELESYLVENGFIDNRPKLTADEIWIQLQATLSQMSLSPEEAEEFLRRASSANYSGK